MKQERIFYSIIFLPIILLSTIILCKDDQITLVQDGVSDYDIIIPTQASQKQNEAASELQFYIQKISQSKLPIHYESKASQGSKHIYLTVNSKSQIDAQQINFSTKDKDLFLSAGSDEALISAVYTFLEQKLGCLWLSPDVEHIPSSKTIRVDANLDYTYTPEIKTRTVHSRLFYENPQFAVKHKVTDESFPYYVPEGRVHTFHRFVPEQKFYESNPEYYAERGGKRLPTQLCLSNQTVLQIVKDSVKALFGRYPDSDVISVSSNDNTQYCTCENCKAIDEAEDSHAGTMIRFVNAVAEEFPEKQISTLAYQYTRKPCKTKPLENVLITLCSIECDRSAPIAEKCKDFAQDLSGWKELTENIRIWDYTTQFTNFLAPFPNMHTLKPNIEFFRDNNAKWIFEQHSSHPSELFELRSYIMAKLLWNPELDFDALVSEFSNAYYEEAGPLVKAYVDLVHQKIKEDDRFFLFLYGDPSQAFDSFLNKNLLMQYKGFFDQAESKVASKPNVLKRVQIARLSIDYAILEACRKSLSSEFTLENHKEVTNLLENFRTKTRDADITLMNEMGQTVTEYCDFYEKSLTLAALPNVASNKKVELLTKPKKYAAEDPQTLTDGAFGGSSFYANWLGFEGNDLEAVIDLADVQEVSSISMAFLQVTNHIVFFPSKVSYFGSMDGSEYKLLGSVENKRPLSKESKINDIQNFNLEVGPTKLRYIKIIGENLKEAPVWHHAAGLPCWIFADEVIVN